VRSSWKELIASQKHGATRMAVVVCSKCGEENPEGLQLCKVCGSRTFVKLSSDRNADDYFRGETKESALALIRGRRETDRKTSTLWAWLPGLLLFPSWGVFALLLLLALAVTGSSDYFEINFNVLYYFVRNIAGILFAVLLGVFVFRLVKRINDHLEREQRLRSKLMAFVRISAKPQGGEQKIIDELLRLSAYDGQALTYEKKHNEVLWGFGLTLLCLPGPTIGLLQGLVYGPHLSLVHPGQIFFVFTYLWSSSNLWAFIAFLYLVESLMRTIYTHEMRWKGFENSISIALRRLDVYPRLTTHVSEVRERNFLLYLFFTIITFGFFQIYWLYVFIKDMNTHLENQGHFEDELAMVLRS